MGSSSGAVHLVTGNTINLTAKAGKIGIGTTDPQTDLQISHPSTSNAVVRVTNLGTSKDASLELERFGGNTHWRISNRGSANGIAGNLVIESAFATMGNVRDEFEFKESLLSNAYFRPIPDNDAYLGTATHRWSVVYAGTGTINTSDERDKSNITNLDYGLAEVLKLRPVSFNWKEKPQWGTKLGLIAQEVKDVVSEVVVHGELDTFKDENGNPQPKSDKYGIYYSDLIPVLIKAIQEMNTNAEEQNALIKKLEREVDNLKNSQR
jgi:hypothetical protein